MRVSTLLFFGFVIICFTALAFLSSTPNPSYLGVPINTDITVKVDKSKNKANNPNAKSSPHVDPRRPTPSPSPHSSPDSLDLEHKLNHNTRDESKPSQDKIVESFDDIYAEIQYLEDSLRNVAQSSSKLKRLLSSTSITDKIDSKSSNSRCIPVEHLHIEPITTYLRSPLWYNNGRRNYAFVEDRSYLDFLANHYIPSSAPRKIYVDLGAAEFNSSVGWMHYHYPLRFDEIHAFEMVPGLFSLSVPSRATLGPSFYDSIHSYDMIVGTRDDPNRRMLNFVRWMQEDLRAAEEDFIVLKIDIEGVEWDLMKAMERAGLHRFVDELFVEIHYREPDLAAYGWNEFSHTKTEAIELLKRWRAMGVYAHYWP